MNINVALSKLGLEKNEITTYLACLELGSSSATQIAERAELKRTTVYGNLQKLVKRGLVSVSGQGHRRIYIPDPPQALQQICQEQTTGLKLILPQLDKIYHQTGTAPKFKFYSGKAGLKRILEHLLQTHPTKVYSFLSPETFLSNIGEDFMREWVKQRVKLGIKNYNLRIRGNEPPEKIFSGQQKYLRQNRYLPPKISFDVSVVMYKNFVFVLSFTEQYGFLVESEDFYRFIKSIFDALWEISEPSDTK